ncbi:MAG: hypothetical protein AAF871_05920 [Pseudomonadota bacterium]
MNFRPETLTAALVVLAIVLALFGFALSWRPATPAMPNSPAEASVASLSLPLPRGIDDTNIPDVSTTETLGVDGLSCGPTLEVTPLPSGLIRASLVAPCRVNAIARFSYGPLEFAERISERGGVWRLLPRLGVETLRVEIDTLRLEAAVEPGSEVLAVGLAWDGPVDLRLNVREFGAELDRSGQRADPPARALGEVFHYGAPGLGQIELYTVPADAGPGLVRLDVAADLGVAGCPAELGLRTFMAGAVPPKKRDIFLTLDQCDGPEQSILLKNLLDDLRLQRP